MSSASKPVDATATALAAVSLSGANGGGAAAATAAVAAAKAKMAEAKVINDKAAQAAAGKELASANAALKAAAAAPPSGGAAAAPAAPARSKEELLESLHTKLAGKDRIIIMVAGLPLSGKSSVLRAIQALLQPGLTVAWINQDEAGSKGAYELALKAQLNPKKGATAANVLLVDKVNLLPAHTAVLDGHIVDLTLVFTHPAGFGSVPHCEFLADRFLARGSHHKGLTPASLISDRFKTVPKAEQLAAATASLAAEETSKRSRANAVADLHSKVFRTLLDGHVLPTEAYLIDVTWTLEKMVTYVANDLLKLGASLEAIAAAIASSNAYEAAI